MVSTNDLAGRDIISSLYVVQQSCAEDEAIVHCKTSASISGEGCYGGSLSSFNLESDKALMFFGALCVTICPSRDGIAFDDAELT